MNIDIRKIIMSFVKEEFDNNPLGFTKEVAMLLTGLGCSNLTKFKLKNISLYDLHYLTEKDLIILDAGDNFDYESFKKLSYNFRKKYDTETTPSISDIIEIFDVNQEQLQVINIYLKYLTKQLQNTSDFFIDKNKNLKVSKALSKASQCVYEEISVLETAINNIQLNEPKCQNNKIKYSFLIGGFGILTIMYLIVKCNRV